MRFLGKTTVAVAALMLAMPIAHARAADAAAGKAVYDKKCPNCHGADGKGDAKVEAEVQARTEREIDGKSDEEMLKLLKEGKKAMPGYEKSLSAADIDNVWAYTKSLLGK